MNPLKKLCKNTLYLIPRLVLFCVVILCFVITFVVSLDCLASYRPPLRQMRLEVIHLIGCTTCEGSAQRK